MSTLTLPSLQDFGDFFSPLVVKELRQGLRTRFFTSALLLFHCFIILLLGTVLLEAPQEAVNGVFWGAAGLMLLVVLPLRGFNALNGEAADGTLDMLTLTSISSFRILHGKWTALFGQTLLVAASLLPYMVARYHFGGVEIVREAVALVVLSLGSGIITAALLAFSSQRSALLRLLLAAAAAGAATPLGFFTAFLVSSNDSDRMLRSFFSLGAWADAGICAAIVLLAAYVIWYFLALGASRIAPPSENHSTRKRLVVLAAHMLLTAGGLLQAAFASSAQEAFWVLMPLLGLTLLACMDMMTEEMPRFPTAVAGLAGRGRVGVLLGRLLHPGWASGVLFSLLLYLMPLAIIVAVSLRVSYWDLEDGPILYVHCLLAAAFVPVVATINRRNAFANWWVVQLCMVAAGILLGLFCAAAGDRNAAIIGFVTPLTTLFGVVQVDYHSRDGMIGIGSLIALIWVGGAVMRACICFSAYSALEKEARDLAAARPEPPTPADA